MVQGTASHVGKSLITGAICRILRDEGFKVSPFKSQNMALNSFVAKDGGEIGRAQAFQAMCAGVEPCVDMNPVLLKPTDDRRSQVIIHGRVYKNMSAAEYHDFKKDAMKYVLESYYRLSKGYDVILVEGAGSPAEINLREGDIANMGIALQLCLPVILVGDIDRGGVFASLAGTMELLSPEERVLVRGFVINKFRGDKELLKGGIEFIEKKTGVPVLGVMPFIKDMNLPEEDGMALENKYGAQADRDECVNISIIKLPHISNFTDFDALRSEHGVRVLYVSMPDELEKSDCIIIPGSKNTLSDLRYLRDKGLAKRIIRFASKGGMVVGICGGFQMLGRSIIDPNRIESDVGETRGLGLLDVETVIGQKKKTCQVEAVIEPLKGGRDFEVAGYEIHMGETIVNESPFAVIKKRNNLPVDLKDGAVSDGGNVLGTYIHGIFDNDSFREYFVDCLRDSKGMRRGGGKRFNEELERGINNLASIVRESIDMEQLCGIINIGSGSVVCS